MAIDTDTPHGQWFERLASKLHDRRTGREGTLKWNRGLLDNKVERPPLDLLRSYFTGDVPLRPDIHAGWKAYVRAFIRAGRYNIATKTVTATSNRMDLRAFFTAAAGDEAGDKFALDIMKANNMRVAAKDTHDTMLWAGDGYAITQPPPKGDRWPRMTTEDPRQVITYEDPLTGLTIAGLKLYRDEWDAADFAYMYVRLEDGTVEGQKLKHEGRTTISNGAFRLNPDQWDLDGDSWEIPGNRMPVHHFRNRFGVGEFEWHLDTLDRINDKIFNEWWISKIQAFRQRAVKNLPDTEKQRNPETNKVEEVEVDYTDMFTASPDEMWQVPGDVEFWESQPVDMTPITAAVQKDIERYASAVNLPLNTITPDAAQGSAEGASLMREEHTFEVEDRLSRVDGEWCSVMADLFAFMDSDEARKRADVTQIEAWWGPVERYSLEQKSSAANGLRGIYPVEAIWTDIMQKRPGDVPRLRQLKGRDILFQAPTPAPAQPPAE